MRRRNQPGRGRPGKLENKMKVNIKTSNRGCGTHTTITDEPYAAALANIDGLATASDNATYRGVKFGRDLQRSMVIRCWADTAIWQAGEKSMQEAQAAWAPIAAAGGGVMDIRDEKLAEILAASKAIDDAIANARPALPTFACAGHKDGCRARVTERETYCRSCEHDEN